jgi:hypothetical protein
MPFGPLRAPLLLVFYVRGTVHVGYGTTEYQRDASYFLTSQEGAATTPRVSTQFKLRISPDLVAALTTAARNHNRRSAQDVAEDVLRIYLPFWEQAEQVKLNMVESQREQLFGPVPGQGTIKREAHIKYGRKEGKKRGIGNG